MIQGIEVQVISKLLTTDQQSDIDALLSYDQSYFMSYAKEMAYIRNHWIKYRRIPSIFDFQLEFADFVPVQVPEPVEYLKEKLRDYRQYLLLMETFNKIKDLGEGDVADAWKYLSMQCMVAGSFGNSEPLDIIKDAQKRADQVAEYARQTRIPTGFPEIDKVMYGGLSTVEELLVIIARSNAGKSWVCTKMMESAQKNGFPVAYYSPEMQAAYLGTRFDTWRGKFSNSDLFQAKYSVDYIKYIKSLPEDETSAYIIEDKDFPDGVSVGVLDPFVSMHGIKLLIIDGLSYMVDDRKGINTQEKYKNIAAGLFQLSKKYGCAVVVAMQSNREVKNKDDKGESIPDLYNAEGSDHPGRIATQAFGIRQIFEKSVLDIKLLKARNAKNQNPVFSYSWDINTGKMDFIPSDDSASPAVVAPTISAPSVSAPKFNSAPIISSPLSLLDDSMDDGDTVEF